MSMGPKPETQSMNAKSEMNKPIPFPYWILWAMGLVALVNVLRFFAAAFLSL